MTLAFFNIGGTEMALIFLIGILLLAFIGNYGKDTQFGYWGSILLAIVVSPVIAFFIILFLRGKQEK